MPEGVEVRLSAEIIKPLVVGKTVIGAYSTPNSRYGDSRENGGRQIGPDYTRFLDFDDANPTKVESVGVRGKFMYWTFTRNWSMLCTFGMTGQWSPIKGKHPCFVFEFKDGPPVYFNDPRHFGTINISWNPQFLLDKLNDLGWDPLQDKLEPYYVEEITSKIRRSDKPIGQILLDQAIFAGVGNYIRAEALYLSKISPWRQGFLMSKEDVISLCNSLIQVMRESYEHQGATILTYKNAYGEEGRYSTLFKVYNKKQDILGNKIVKENTPEGRTIHWCPAIQK